MKINKSSKTKVKKQTHRYDTFEIDPEKATRGEATITGVVHGALFINSILLHLSFDASLM